ncbi:MAG TPA: prolipoprotein diacylglyceryl transferase family protein [Acidimicrobiales bacterium]|nr:prolipoprotein diacylglyceryl transferase family protein [Acidimicrobiales bacterium]
MRPVPVDFHVGPLLVHTYGIGLAVTFWFAYRYFARRLRAHGYPDSWLGTTFVVIVVAAIVGARAVHVIANLSYYEAEPSKIVAIWQGGLSSFGGLALGVPAGFISARRRCPQLRAAVAADLVAPVLAVGWAVGRLLGPQLMVGGGGKPTTAWFGMYYAGEVGKRLPVPVIQAIECFVVYLVALKVQSVVQRHGGPLGVVTAVTASLWGLSRFFDEYVLLPHDNGTDGVEIAALAFFAVGMVTAAVLWRRLPAGSAATDPWAAPAAPGAQDEPGLRDGHGALGGLGASAAHDEPGGARGVSGAHDEPAAQDEPAPDELRPGAASAPQAARLAGSRSAAAGR